MVDFGESLLFVFLLAQKKNQKKGTLPLMLRKGSESQRTTVITTCCSRHYDNFLSLNLQLV